MEKRRIMEHRARERTGDTKRDGERDRERESVSTLCQRLGFLFGMSERL